MLASSIVNYGIPAAIVLVLIFGVVAYRIRQRGVAAGAAVPESSAPHAAPSDSSASGDEAEDGATVESIGDAEAEAEAAIDDGDSGSGEEEEEVATVRERTGRTRSLFSNAFASIRGKGRIDDSTWDELEETLLRADIGIGLTTKLLDPLRTAAKAGDIKNADDAIAALRSGMTQQLSSNNRSL